MLTCVRALLFVLLFAAVAAAGCGDDEMMETAAGDGDGDGDGDNEPPQTCIDSIGQSSTDFIEAEVFGRGCTLGSCHDSDNPAAGLDLTAGNSLAAMLGVESSATGQALVVAGSPNDSYLLVVIDHVSKMDAQGRAGRFEGDLPGQGTMPLGLPLLCEEKRDAVAAWIAGLSQ